MARPGLNAWPVNKAARVTGSGYSDTELATGTADRYAAEILGLDKALANWEPTVQVKATRSSRNLELASCACQPRRSLRISRTAFDRGPVICGVCGEPFEVVSASSPGSA